jgi:capsular exopolysaccharide synthesis family protein
MTLRGSSRPRRLLAAHAVWILLTTAVVMVGAWLYQALQSPVYTSQASVVLESVLSPSTAPVAPAMGTEKQVGLSGVVLSRAAGQLGTDERRLSQRVDVNVPPDANVLNISCTASTAALAQKCAQTVVDSYVAYRNGSPSASPPSGPSASPPSGPAESPLHADVVTPADLPTGPTRTSLAVLLAVGLVVGLSLGVATAYLRDLQDDRLRDVDDLASQSGLPVLPLVTRDGEAEALRAVRVQLHALSGELHGRTVLVAPIGPGRDDASVAAGLATTFARSGSSVVLVDGDLRSPRLHRYFGLPPSHDDNPGLTGLLQGRAQVAEVRRETTVPRLRLITAGPVEESAGDLMVPEELAATLDELRGWADLVVVECAPVLAGADTIALASAADVCLLVAEVGRTKRRAVRQAVAALPHRPDLLVAAVPLEPGPRPPALVAPRHAVKPSPAEPLPAVVTSPNGSRIGSGDEADASLPLFQEIISGKAVAEAGEQPPRVQVLDPALPPDPDPRDQQADADARAPRDAGEVSVDAPGAVDAHAAGAKTRGADDSPGNDSPGNDPSADDSPSNDPAGSDSGNDPAGDDAQGTDAIGQHPTDAAAGDKDQGDRDEAGREEPGSGDGDEGEPARPDMEGVR